MIIVGTKLVVRARLEDHELVAASRKSPAVGSKPKLEATQVYTLNLEGTPLDKLLGVLERKLELENPSSTRRPSTRPASSSIKTPRSTSSGPRSTNCSKPCSCRLAWHFATTERNRRRAGEVAASATSVSGGPLPAPKNHLMLP